MAVSLSDSPPSQGPMCPVCFRDYSANENDLIPRILQCGHTYCTQCLEKLLNMEPEEDEFEQIVLNIRHTGGGWRAIRRFPLRVTPHHASNELKCPTCNHVNHIYNRDITSLTKNFALLSCRPQDLKSPQSKNRQYCEQHDHEKRIYCNDCKHVVCAYCQLYGEHKGHDCVIATEVSKPAVEALKKGKDGVLSDLEQASKGEEQVNAAISRLERGKKRCSSHVRRHFGRLVGQLTNRRDALLASLGSWSEEQMYILQAQLDTLQEARKDCETMLNDCQELIEGDPLEALMEREGTMERVESLHSRIAGLSFQPLINPSMKCNVDVKGEELVTSLMESCSMVYDTAAQEESESESEEEHEHVLLQETASASSASAATIVSNDGGFSVQDTQDPASVPDFASGLPKLDPAAFPGATNNWFRFGHHPSTQTHMRLNLPFSNHRYHSDDSDTLKPTQAMDSASTMFFNPIAPKPKMTNLLNSFRLQMPSSDGSDSEGESFHYTSPSSFLQRNNTGASREDSSINGRRYFPPIVDNNEFRRYTVFDDSSLADDEDDSHDTHSALTGTISSEDGPAALFLDGSRSAHSSSPENLGPPSHTSLDGDELVFPIGHQYSWSADTGNGRSLMLEIDHNGTSLQLSIQAPQGELPHSDMDLTDLDEAEEDLPTVEEVSD